MREPFAAALKPGYEQPARCEADELTALLRQTPLLTPRRTRGARGWRHAGLSCKEPAGSYHHLGDPGFLGALRTRI